jgi:hypothetical protein
MNKQGALNGHIPVTAVNSAILVLAAVLHDADQVVFSNERSASYGSLIPGTGEVNHQWSKGWDFERDFARYVRESVAEDVSYFSLLRPFSELPGSLPVSIITMPTFPVATATSTSLASARRSAGAALAPSAISSSWPWRRSCQNRD